jgi:hypothetical protein
MSTTQQDKPGSKPRQRSRKAEQRGQKAEQSPKLEQNEEQIGTAAVATETAALGEAVPAELAVGEAYAPADVPLIGQAMTDQALTDQALTDQVLTDQAAIGQAVIGQVAPADAPSINPGAPADHGSIGIETIANAYSSYANKSWLETGSLVEKLIGARSFDRVIEIQTEFARQAYASLVAESQNICDLYSRLARQAFRQTFEPWQGFAAGTRSK